MQKPIPSTLPLRSSECEEYEDNRGSSLLSAEMCEISKKKSYELLCKMFAATPGRTKDELEPILGKKFMEYTSGNLSDFERQKQRGSTATDYHAADENDEIHRVMMEVEPLLEAFGKRNWRSIMLTHDEFPCHCLLQTWWYAGHNNMVSIWDSGELLSMGLSDSSQPITVVIVRVTLQVPVELVDWQRSVSLKFLTTRISATPFVRNRSNNHVCPH